MNVRFSAILLATVLLVLGSSSPAQASLFVYDVKHDWSVTVGDQRYGLIEFRNPCANPHHTELYFGKFWYFTSLSAWQVAAGGGVLTIFLVLTSVICSLMLRPAHRSALQMG